MRNLNAKVFKLYVPKILDNNDLKKSMESELFNISTTFSDLYNLTDTSGSFYKTIPNTYTISDTTPILISTVTVEKSENYVRVLSVEIPYFYKTVSNLGETDTDIVIDLKNSEGVSIGSETINGVGFNPYELPLPKVIGNINVGYKGDIKIYISLRTTVTVDPVIFKSRSDSPKVVIELSSNVGDLS